MALPSRTASGIVAPCRCDWLSPPSCGLQVSTWTISLSHCESRIVSAPAVGWPAWGRGARAESGAGPRHPGLFGLHSDLRRDVVPRNRSGCAVARRSDERSQKEERCEDHKVLQEVDDPRCKQPAGLIHASRQVPAEDSAHYHANHAGRHPVEVRQTEE